MLMWMHHSINYSSPWVLYFMCSCVLLSSGRFGPLRAEVGVGLRRVRLVQAPLSSPPSAGLVPLSVGLRFSFPSPFQGLPFPGQVCCVGVLSFPLLLCSPLRVLVKYFSFHFHCHFHVHFHFICPAAVGRVCVYHLYRCKTSIYRRGTCIYVISLCRGAHVTSSANEAE